MTLRKPISVRIREDLLEEVQRELNAGYGQRVHRGKMQSLIESLFIRWLKEQHERTQSNG